MTAPEYLQAAIDSGRVIQLVQKMRGGNVGAPMALVLEAGSTAGSGLAVLLEECGNLPLGHLPGGSIVAFQSRGAEHVIVDGKHLRREPYDETTWD